MGTGNVHVTFRESLVAIYGYFNAHLYTIVCVQLMYACLISTDFFFCFFCISDRIQNLYYAVLINEGPGDTSETFETIWFNEIMKRQYNTTLMNLLLRFMTLIEYGL